LAVACGAQSKPAEPPPPSSTGAGPAPCSVTPEPQPCGTTPAAPSGQPNSAEKFPFPGEAGGTSTAPSLGGVPDAPDPTANPAGSAKKNFPFPGEAGGGAPKPGSSSSSSSSDDDAAPADPSATPDLKDKGSEGTPPAPGRHILHRVNPVGTKLQSNDEREQEDLDVAHFYIQSGDLQGAYLRSQDAVKTAPDDPDAHFALAEIALKLNKKGEAITEYNACLKLDPTEKEMKDARKALARLKP
jgi:TolA-binding protein